MTLSLLILLMFNSVLPAIRIQFWSGLLTQVALVKAQSGEMIEAVQRRVESLLTTSDTLENSPESADDEEFAPHSERDENFNFYS